MPICFIDQHKLLPARGLGEHDASEQDKIFYRRVKATAHHPLSAGQTSFPPQLVGDCDAKHEVRVLN